MGFDGVQLAQVDPHKIVILHALEDLPEPDYCIHGQVQCMECERWCWLGHATFDAVAKDGASPMCVPCGSKTVRPDNLIGLYRDTMGGHD